MAGSLEHLEARAGDGGLEVVAVRGRNEAVLGAPQEQRRRLDPVQALLEPFVGQGPDEWRMLARVMAAVNNASGSFGSGAGTNDASGLFGSANNIPTKVSNGMPEMSGTDLAAAASRVGKGAFGGIVFDG